MGFVLHFFVTKVIKLLNHSCFSHKKDKASLDPYIISRVAESSR